MWAAVITAIGACVTAVIEAFTGKKQDKDIQAGRDAQKVDDQAEVIKDAKRQAQVYADRPTNDDEFAARLRNVAKSEPRYPSRSDRT